MTDAAPPPRPGEDRLSAARRFVTENHRAVLITRRANGELQSSPVAASTDAEGHILVSTRTGLAKERNVTRDQRVSLCVVSDGWWGPWVHVDGTAEVVRPPKALDLLVEYYRSVAGEHPDWDDYRAAMVAEQRVILRIAVHHASALPS